MQSRTQATRGLVKQLRALPPATVWERMTTLSPGDLEALLFTWAVWARPKQLPPPEPWTYWMLKAGRGYGKTRAGAEMVRQWNAEGWRYVNLVGATADDARDIMVEGESGVLACCPVGHRPTYKRAERRLLWPNGAVSLIFTADEPERLRGKQHEKLWADELASWRYPEAWDQAKFGLRLGHNPQAVITTTPRPTQVIRELIADPACVMVEGATFENRANLADAFFGIIVGKYEGTRMGRQELYAEMLEDNPFSIFSRDDIDKYRLERSAVLPEDRIRCLVAIDPAVSANKTSDETGIVGGFSARHPDGREHYYILGDYTEPMLSPEKWAQSAVMHAAEIRADGIVAEVNNGGDLVESVLRNVDPDIGVRSVHASRGKIIRAEPIAALYSQGRVHHVGGFPKLEDQMCDYVPGESGSPDRMDALVWLVSDLMGNAGNIGFLAFTAQEQAKIRAVKRPQSVWEQIGKVRHG